MLAVLTKVPELMLAKDDAKQLAVGICNVSRHYNVQAAQKTIDWTNLMMVAGTIYGAKLMLARQRIQQQKAAKQAPPSEGGVLDFNAAKSATAKAPGDSLS